MGADSPPGSWRAPAGVSVLIGVPTVAAADRVFNGLAESGKPSHRVDYHQRLCDWATRWTLEARAREDRHEGHARRVA